jgi:hypothetical protein
MTLPLRSRGFVPLACVSAIVGGLVTTDACLAARPRGPSAAQVKKMKEQMEFAQAEMQRFQRETAAIQQRLVAQFDENGNGKLEGAEKAKYNKYMAAVQKGKEPNPFAEVVPIGQGPKPTAKK